MVRNDAGLSCFFIPPDFVGARRGSSEEKAQHSCFLYDDAVRKRAHGLRCGEYWNAK